MSKNKLDLDPISFIINQDPEIVKSLIAARSGASFLFQGIDRISGNAFNVLRDQLLESKGHDSDPKKLKNSILKNLLDNTKDEYWNEHSDDILTKAIHKVRENLGNDKVMEDLSTLEILLSCAPLVKNSKDVSPLGEVLKLYEEMQEKDRKLYELNFKSCLRSLFSHYPDRRLCLATMIEDRNVVDRIRSLQLLDTEFDGGSPDYIKDYGADYEFLLAALQKQGRNQELEQFRELGRKGVESMKLENIRNLSENSISSLGIVSSQSIYSSILYPDDQRDIMKDPDFNDFLRTEMDKHGGDPRSAIYQDLAEYQADYMEKIKILSHFTEATGLYFLEDQDQFALYRAGGNALLWAIREKLLNPEFKGLDPNKVDDKGLSLMHYAAKDGNEEVFKALARVGGNPFMMNGGKVSAVDVLSLMKDDNIASRIFKGYMLEKEIIDYTSKYRITDAKKNTSNSIVMSLVMKNYELATNILNLSSQEDQISGLRSALSLGLEDGSPEFIGVSIREMKKRNVKFDKIVVKDNDQTKEVKLIEWLIQTKNHTLLDVILKEAYELIDEKAIETAVTFKNLDALKLILKHCDADKKTENKDVKEIDPTSALTAAYYLYKNSDDDNLIADCIKSILSFANRDKSSVRLKFDFKDNYDESLSFPMQLYLDLQEAKMSVKDNKLIPELSEMFNSFLAQKSNVLDLKDKDGKDLLMLAAKFGDLDTCQKLVKKAPNLKLQKDKFNNTALHYAVINDKADIFNFLIEDVALSSDMKNKLGTNLLMAASFSGNYDMVKSLKAFYITAVDKFSDTALHYLSKGSDVGNSVSILNELLGLGVDIDASNKYGKTPLIEAIISGNALLITELIKKGADVNKSDVDGNTPLIYACLLNNADSIEAILNSTNVNLNLKNKKGVSAYSIVHQRDKLNIDEKPNALEEDKALDNKTDFNLNQYADANSIADLPRDLTNRNIGSESVLPSQLLNYVWRKNSYKNLKHILLERGAEIQDMESEAMRLMYYTNMDAYFASSLTNASSYLSGDIADLDHYIASEKHKLYDIDKYIDQYKSRINERNVVDEDVKAIMIGNVDDKGLGFVRVGKDLEQDYKISGMTSGIYEVNSLRDYIKDDKAKCFHALEVLTANYSRLQRSLESQPWYYVLMPWKESGLKKAIGDVVDAYDVILKDKAAVFLKSDGKVFEDQFKKVVKAINSPEKIRKLVSIMDYNGSIREEDNPVNKLVNQIINKEIAVSPVTYYHCYNFAIEKEARVKKGSIFTSFMKVLGLGYSEEDKKAYAGLIGGIKEDDVKGFLDAAKNQSKGRNSLAEDDSLRYGNASLYIKTMMDRYKDPKKVPTELALSEYGKEIYSSITNKLHQESSPKVVKSNSIAKEKDYKAPALDLDLLSFKDIVSRISSINALNINAPTSPKLVKENGVSNKFKKPGNEPKNQIKDDNIGIETFSVKKKKVSLAPEYKPSNVLPKGDNKMFLKPYSNKESERLYSNEDSRIDYYDILNKARNIEVFKSPVVNGQFTTTGSAIPSPNSVAAINSDAVVKKTMEKEVVDQKDMEALKAKRNKETKI